MNLNLREIYVSYAEELGVEVRELDDRDRKMAITNYILMLKDAIFQGGRERIRKPSRKGKNDD